MKSLLRTYIINLGALLVTTKVLPGLSYNGELQTLLLGALVFMLINFFVVPMLKLMFLPLNLLTFGFFSWIINVLVLFILTSMVSTFRLVPFQVPSFNIGFLIVPTMMLNTLQVAFLASLMIAITTNIIKWLIK